MNRGKYQKGITPIEDLIDIDNYEENLYETPLGNKVNKYIRNTDKNAMNSALNGIYDNPANYQQQQHIQRQYPQRTTALDDDVETYVTPSRNAFTSIPNESYESKQNNQQPIASPNYHYQFTCPDVFEHISKCPICSKIYNQDKTIYILFIIVLSVIILILLKQLFNK